MTPCGALSVDGRKRARVMRYVRSHGLLDRRFRTLVRGSRLMIPITVLPDSLPLEGDAVAADPSEFTGMYSGKPGDIARMLANTGKDLECFLPKKWEIVGSSVILKIDRRLSEQEVKVAAAYAAALNARSVYSVTGRIAGGNRRPSLKLLHGPGGETTHQENGVNFVLDPASVMFSSANHDERMRMGNLECDGEVVVDMFAGIGHLSMPIAVHSSPAKVIAAESDPVTFSYLLKTVDANDLRSVYSASNVDNRKLEAEDCDRIIMGYLDGTRRWLGKALSMSRKGTVIHFHEEVRHGMEKEWRELIEKKYCGGAARMLSMRRVKGYSAVSDHLVMDIEVTVKR